MKMQLNVIAIVAVAIFNCSAVLAIPIAKLNEIEHPIERRAAILQNMVSFSCANV
ncbi:uncharacterized protein FA14DRAFT_161870 [Meira miltonrushii]|uniref:Uncharacterized protein n=1 Tax=Meira miltonrushii TaxID=1280837 RepID=A0A316V4I1_9BASI|nr:uncharacterized protein FA14DRAFT_161870 [Meira miltonrushii]PWN32430.1 hypothetical protein FA14DRAFT_161870 [Meira miltonrushii]